MRDLIYMRRCFVFDNSVDLWGIMVVGDDA
jgi:hypothetical protein